MLLELLPVAVEYDIGYDEYWNMALSDISIFIKAKHEADLRRHKLAMQENAYQNYALAGLIGLAVNAPKRFPSNVYKAYPELFSVEKQEQDWQEVKAYMQGFSTVHNKKWKGGNS